MTRTGKDRPQEMVRQKLATTIRRQAGSHATRGLLRSMPTFKVVKEMPEHLENLLDRLESSELQPGDGPAR
ncbi:hypothetical protein [Aquamicrobium ahrensii]|uniref:Anti-sigma factor NepR domain-containing protein n=1 Tax=Aquamicrobium ahrensii TaxID=469551 RepID=A0ABV2KP39_9HYPH